MTYQEPHRIIGLANNGGISIGDEVSVIGCIPTFLSYCNSPVPYYVCEEEKYLYESPDVTETCSDESDDPTSYLMMPLFSPRYYNDVIACNNIECNSIHLILWGLRYAIPALICLGENVLPYCTVQIKGTLCKPINCTASTFKYGIGYLKEMVVLDKDNCVDLTLDFSIYDQRPQIDLQRFSTDIQCKIMDSVKHKTKRDDGEFNWVLNEGDEITDPRLYWNWRSNSKDHA